MNTIVTLLIVVALAAGAVIYLKRKSQKPRGNGSGGSPGNGGRPPVNKV